MSEPNCAVEMTAVKVYPFRQAHRPLLWLGEKDAKNPRLLPIAIGEFEAAAIHMQLTGETPRRPISYDLFTSVLNKLDVPVQSVEIHTVHNSTFFARISFRDEKNRCLDARPSDAVALALRNNAPIYVSHNLLEYAGIEPLNGNQGFEPTMEQFYKIEPQIIETEPEKAPSEEHQTRDPSTAIDQEHQVTGHLTQNPRAPEPENQISQLQTQLDQAIVCEEYEEAARLRDKIFHLKKIQAR